MSALSSDNNDSSDVSSDDSSKTTSSSDDNDRGCASCDHDNEHAAQVETWTIKIVIGLSLCPWAGKSHSRGLLRYVTCEGDKPVDVARLVESEIEMLTRESTSPLSSVLVVCPHVNDWKDFPAFDDFVRSGIRQHVRDDKEIFEKITLVAFHPSFLRWHGLPDGVGVGSVVQSYWGIFGRKSIQTAPATIIDTGTKTFGMRKVKVRFHHSLEAYRQEQFVPIDWIDSSCSGAPLPDNIMYRAPYPTIHVIVNKDLASLSIRDVSRVKRLNSKRMMKLGWQGVERRLAEMPDDFGSLCTGYTDSSPIETST